MIILNELLERAKSERIAIHTPKEEQAKALLTELDKKGYKWISGDKLTTRINYEVHKENTCYDFDLNKQVCYSPLSFYQDEGYTIIKFSDINFTDKPSKITPKSGIKIIYQSKDKLTTCVVFEDGTKVKVKKHKGDKGSIYTAVAYAITKKTYGSNKVFTEIVDEKLYKGGNKMKYIRTENRIIDKAELKLDTHIVIKKDDLGKYLNPAQVGALMGMLSRINEKREESGKKVNDYYVVNTDEPYAQKVLDLILEEEAKK